MSLVDLTVIYGHLEGAGGRFARDPTGYLSIDRNIFEKHGLKVSWSHVQGTEERYRQLENDHAQISLVVGRASLRHFLALKTTRILGAAMNRCPYYLITRPESRSLADLKGKIVACREEPSRNTPIAEAFNEQAHLRIDHDLTLLFFDGDHEAFNSLIEGRAQAALLPRPFAFIAEERGFKRIEEWPEIVDDPLPITIETTAKQWSEREKELRTFLSAHSEGIRYFRAHRADALEVLTSRFGHSAALAQKIFDDYITCMDDTLKVDFKQFEKLLSQIAPDASGRARQIAAEWVVPGALRP